MTLGILAHFFLVRLAVRLKKVAVADHSPSPDAVAPDVTDLSFKSTTQFGSRLVLATPQLACLSLPSQTPSRLAAAANPVRHRVWLELPLCFASLVVVLGCCQKL